MGGSSLQLLFTCIVLLLCLKPTLGNYWRVGDANHSCIERERQALLKIKADLIDDYGFLSSWSTAEGKKDCCKWSGVSCSNQTSHVIMLNLNFSVLEPLRGKLSPFLTDLQYLNYLDVSFNDFNQSPIPESIGSLTYLSHLDVVDANFGRNIPFQLGNLSSLQYLDLSWNNFNNPKSLEWLSQLSSLKYLGMGSINLSKVNNWPQIVNKLPYLTSLYLHHCNLSNMIPDKLEWLFNSNSSVVELDLSNNQFQGMIPDAFVKIKSLAHLYLDHNEFEGGIPKSFGSMCNLKTLSIMNANLNGKFLGIIHNLTGCAQHSIEKLYLEVNQITGKLPDLKTFPSLSVLSLSYNRLNGTVPESLGKKSNLETLRLGDNSFEGVIFETHFSKLEKLKILDLSNNPLIFNFSSNWVPPFQLEDIFLESCQLGPRFPKWLQTQKKCNFLVISNSGISDTISHFYWDFSPKLQILDLSKNQISGHIPYFPLEISNFPFIDLSSNKLEGKIPSFLFKAAHLNLSQNMFSESIQSLCAIRNEFMIFLDLSNNRLSGELPDCWMHLKGLKILNLKNNNFFGKIPRSMGLLLGIETIELRNNSFSGEIPSSLKKCTKLKFVNLGHNNLSGQIPMWLGTSNPNLAVLILRSNHLHGSMPSHLCHLAHLQLLDLALNQISGSIPKCLNNISVLTQKLSSSTKIMHNYVEILGMALWSIEYDDEAFWMWKGSEHEYKHILGLLKSIDLSSNKLTGTIPEEIMELVELRSLNLSRNHLVGQINSNIGALQSLDFLDLSKNYLSGRIPFGLSHIDRLSVLDLSNNNLSGKIPTGPQLSTFNASSYEGNPNLCGDPLPKLCLGEGIAQNPAMNGSREHVGIQDEEEGFINLGFYISVALGFIAGFWGVVGTLLLNMSLQVTYFRFLNDFKDRLYVAIALNMARFQRQL